MKPRQPREGGEGGNKGTTGERLYCEVREEVPLGHKPQDPLPPIPSNDLCLGREGAGIAKGKLQATNIRT